MKQRLLLVSTLCFSINFIYVPFAQAVTQSFPPREGIFYQVKTFLFGEDKRTLEKNKSRSLASENRPSATNGSDDPLAELNTYLLDRFKLPNPEAFLRWSNVYGYRTSDLDLNTIPKVPFRCKESELYPVNPQQTGKKYHLYYRAYYDQRKLKAESTVCKIGAKTVNGLGFRTCFMPDTYEVSVMSDIYQDNCGNYYRGYWTVEFLKRDDNMGFLFSKGRAAYPKPGSEFPGELEDGPTYPVDKSDFIFFTDLFTGDKESLEVARETALKYTHIYNPKTKLFDQKH